MAGKKKNTGSMDLDMSILDKELGLEPINQSEHGKIVDWLPTFFPEVDKILGGGLPFGRMVELAGRPGSGKCLVPESMIQTPNGYKSLKDIFNENGYETYTVRKHVPVEIELINRYGEIEKTSHITFNGKHKVTNITTRSGAEQIVTKNHPLLIIENGVKVWKHASDIKPGDFLVVRRGDNYYGSNSIPKDDAYALGALVADGHFGESRLSFTNDDEFVLDIVKKYMVKVFGKVNTYKKQGQNSTDFQYNSKVLVKQWQEDNGITKGNAKHKRVPKVIMEANKETQISFIQGYFDCESHPEKRVMTVTSASKSLLKDVKLMLLNMGIISYTRKLTVKGYEHNYYGTLHISGSDIDNFFKMIGYRTPSRKFELIPSQFAHSNIDMIPNGREMASSYYKSAPYEERSVKVGKLITNHTNISRRNMRKLLTSVHGYQPLREMIEDCLDDSYYYDEVVSNVEGEKVPTFDFTLPKTHSFINEGVVNHNSSLTHHLAKVASYLGVKVVLLDIEGTTDADRLAHLGVKVENVSVPTVNKNLDENITVELVGEKVYNIVIKYGEAYPDKKLMFIWDSIGDTPSKVEVNKEFGEKEVGSRAAAIKQFLLKSGDPIKKTKSLFIGINQVRANVGNTAMFAPDVVPGGMQWEHAASQRLATKNRGAIKKGTEKIGQETGIFLNKSKVSPPFQEARAYMLSDTGFDYEYNISRFALDAGILKGVSASYEYVDANGEIHKKKRDNFVEWMRTDEGKHVRKEMLHKLIKINFPDNFPALHNRSVDISKWEDAIGLEELYKEDNTLPENNDSQMSEDELGDEIENESKS